MEVKDKGKRKREERRKEREMRSVKKEEEGRRMRENGLRKSCMFKSYFRLVFKFQSLSKKLVRLPIISLEEAMIGERRKDQETNLMLKYTRSPSFLITKVFLFRNHSFL